MKLFKWQQGRQHGCEYKKFPLWYFRIFNYGFDAYILKYETNTRLGWHKDPVENGKHYRLNVRLKGYNTFFWKNTKGRKCVQFSPNFVWFRPDITWHMLSTYSRVIKLSFGFVKFNK